MQIELVKIGEVVNDGKLAKMEVFYTREGKAANRKLAAIGKTKEVMQTLAKCKSGDVVDIDLDKVEKDGQTFYNWVGINKVEIETGEISAPSAPVKGRSSYQVKSTYETPEERARKQAYITRSWAGTTALAFLQATKNGKFDLKDVLGVAETLTGFVFQTNGQQTVNEAAVKEGKPVDITAPFEDDIPF